MGSQWEKIACKGTLLSGQRDTLPSLTILTSIKTLCLKSIRAFQSQRKRSCLLDSLIVKYRTRLFRLCLSIWTEEIVQQILLRKAERKLDLKIMRRLVFNEKSPPQSEISEPFSIWVRALGAWVLFVALRRNYHNLRNQVDSIRFKSLASKVFAGWCAHVNEKRRSHHLGAVVYYW